ncbi:hypothetical protein GCM10011369_00010 [Neiella marina]|uniref:Uncharacterized protein n=1 Tax=Neiella marina TaxID=508461 RepID=A0A8J2XMA5_9GAMM|nr:hypothetical protein [Neiella marina]GGA62764.1 hypothetical protein GCM10011369_00010 [Neiella marina]
MELTRNMGDTMITLFECWNGGVVEWDGLSSPQISFSFSVTDGDVLAFFLLCGRIAQLHTKTDWQLRFGVTPVSIPALPQREVCSLLESMRQNLGYMPLLQNDVTKDINAEETLLRRLQWVEVATGRIDTYTPFVGLRKGKHTYMRRLPQRVLTGSQTEVWFTGGQLQGGIDHSLIKILGLHRDPALRNSSVQLQEAWNQLGHASNL